MILTFLRAVAWFGVFVVFWSLNVRWGTDENVGAGPPGQWERHVVGSGLLAFVGAIALCVSGRKGNPPNWTARGIALAAGALIVAIALLLRSRALSGFEDLIAGPGWTWLLSGGGFILSAAVMSLALKPAQPVRQEVATKKVGGDAAAGGGPAKKTGAPRTGARRGKKKRRKR
jgi:hypothetical protein